MIACNAKSVSHTCSVEEVVRTAVEHIIWCEKIDFAHGTHHLLGSQAFDFENKFICFKGVTQNLSFKL
jgi:hypothetical protein